MQTETNNVNAQRRLNMDQIGEDRQEDANSQQDGSQLTEIVRVGGQ